MSTREFSWKTIDGLKIYGKYWAPDNGIKGVVCLVHGMGEHINRYEHVAEMLTDHGYALIGYDHRGHGQSEGQRGHTPSYDYLLNSVDDLLSKAQEYFPEIPQILYGHSMGGGLVLNYALQWQPQIAGVIASSPWLKLAFEPPKALVTLAKVVNRVLPSFSQSTKLDAKAISRDQAVVKAYEDDPLVHDKISSGFYLSTYQAGLWALDHADELHLPLLLFHGTEDQLTSYEASKEFAKKAGDLVTFRLFNGAYHEIHNDLCKQELFDLMINWLDSRVGNEEEE
jgi:acylglycerol lipase